MLSHRWRVLSGLRRRDWPSRLITVAQTVIGFVALLGLLGMLTDDPLLLLGFGMTQGLLAAGVVLFAVVAVFTQRTMILEEFGPGEFIFREGEKGRHVFVIKSGTVEVLAKQGDGSQKGIGQLGPGDHFGEIALIHHAPRTATVRTITAVQVFKLSPSNFLALYTNLPGLRTHFNDVMKSRLSEFELRR